MVRDQLTDAIEAATILRNGGKTVRSDAARPVSASNVAESALAEELVETGVIEHTDQ